MSLPDRFMSKVHKMPNGCWVWTASSSVGRGLRYGRFQVGRRNKSAHRYAYLMTYGPIEPGLTIDHLCRNTLCVNPKHLEAVTIRENILRGNCASSRHARQTHCKRGHPFAGDNLRIRTGKKYERVCRACVRFRREHNAA